MYPQQPIKIDIENMLEFNLFWNYLSRDEVQILCKLYFDIAWLSSYDLLSILLFFYIISWFATNHIFTKVD